MSEITQAEKYLLDQIRQGRPEGWSQLIERYQGRLLAFARSRLPQRADAEDVVQETFLAFLKTLSNFRGEASLETWLFTILRRKIIDIYRSQRSKVTCLLQDVYKPAEGDSRGANPFSQMPAPDPTASWYVRRDEQYHLQREALTGALRELVNGFKKSLNFRDLQIVEMLFYCHLSNKDVAEIAKVSDKNIAVIKHRCLKQVRELVAGFGRADDLSSPDFECLLNEVWETQRLSCPKRSTVGAYLLKTLDKAWHDYVGFHLNKLGCHFCRANLEDLKQQTTEEDTSTLRKRIMESTVGFLHKG